MWAQQLIAGGVFESIDVSPPLATDLLPGQVILKMAAGGICGSDHPKFTSGGRPMIESGPLLWPRPVGFPLHEIAGVVTASRSDRLSVGAQVVGWASNGSGLVEFVTADAPDLIAYDVSLGHLESILIQPLACVIYALERVDVHGKHVAVLGLGSIGALFAHVARSMGARWITGVDPIDRSALRAAGVVDDLVIADGAAWADSADGVARPEVVIEAVGHQLHTLNDSIRVAAVDGTILYFGIPDQETYPIDMEKMMRKNLTLIAGVTRNRVRALLLAQDYLLKNRHLADRLITHHFAKTDVGEAFRTATTPAVGTLKVVIDFDAVRLNENDCRGTVVSRPTSPS